MEQKGDEAFTKTRSKQQQTGFINKILSLGLVLEGNVDVLAHHARHLIHLPLHFCHRAAPALISITNNTSR